jgi:hypothetical protein
MDERDTIVRMLQQLLKELELVSAQGAGYYTCSPFARRYNKLLGAAAHLLNGNTIMATFEALPSEDPKDPADKSKMLLEIRIEATQLISLLESAKEHPTA